MKDKEKQNCDNCVCKIACFERANIEEIDGKKSEAMKSWEKYVKQYGCQYYQPKIDKDSVVLSREEYESITDNVRNDIAIDIIRAVFETIDWSKNTNSFTKGILKLISEYSIDLEIIENERKETVEKILKLVKQKAWCYQEDENGKAWTYSITATQLKKLAKQFGVKLKEN